MTGDDLIHIGERSWWDGSVRTLCGLRLPRADRIVLAWLSSIPTCPVCRAREKSQGE